jgi:hypothetical protein
MQIAWGWNAAAGIGSAGRARERTGRKRGPVKPIIDYSNLDAADAVVAIAMFAGVKQQNGGLCGGEKQIRAAVKW